MLASRVRWCAVTVILALGPAVAGGQSVNRAGAGATDAGLVIGDAYTLRAERQGVQERFTGNLVKFNARWVVLRCISESRSDHNGPVLSMIPFMGRRFRGVSSVRTDEYVWIPREAATVEARNGAAHQANVQPPAGDAPPPHSACAVQLVRAGKAVRRQGGIEAVTDDELTISMPKKVKVAFAIPTTPESLASMPNNIGVNRYETHYVREQLAHRDILCVRVANFDAATFGRAP